MRKFSWFTTKRSKNGMYYGIGLYNLDEGLFVKYKPNMKGGHTHNHVKNAHKRMKHCAICYKPITKYEGFSSRFIGHICMECYIEECREHAVMAGIPTIGSLFDDLRNPYIRRK